MEEVLGKLNQLESIILNVKNELEEKIEELRGENQAQHEEIHAKIENFREENQKQHEEMCLQIYGKMILENTKLERKIKQELQNQFTIERAKNVERIKRLNDLDSRIEKTEVDVMLCQDEISELKRSMV